MIEVTIINYLSSVQGSAGIGVYAEMPTDTNPPFILVQKTGERVSDRVHSATIAVQSYATSMYNAAALNEQVKEWMDGLTALDGIGSVRLNSDYNYTDTQTKKYRYQAVFDIVYY